MLRGSAEGRSLGFVLADCQLLIANFQRPCASRRCCNIARLCERINSEIVQLPPKTGLSETGPLSCAFGTAGPSAVFLPSRGLINPELPLAPRYRSRASVQRHARPSVALRPANLP